MTALTPLNETQRAWNTDKIITWDVETDDWTKPTAVGVRYPNGKYEHYHTGNYDDPIKAFVDHVVLSHKTRGMRLVAHNGGGYDFGFLLPHLFEQEKYQLDILENGQGNFFFIKLTEEYESENGNNVKHNTYLQDSMALLPRGLDYLADAYADSENIEFEDEEYKKINHNWEEMEPEFRQRMLDYLENDCNILYEILENFTSKVNELVPEGGNKIGCSLTMGSTTLNMYRANYLADDDQYRIPQSPRHIEEISRQTYFAGRTEVFRMTGEPEDYPLYHYDVSSLFPHCYTNHKMPTGQPSYTTDPTNKLGTKPVSPIDVMKDDKNVGGMVKIEGYVPEDVKYPVLPQRVETEDAQAEKVIFATGKIRGWYMWREVEYALEVGALEDVEYQEAVVCELTDQFSEYGQTLYDLKNEIDSDENPALYVTVKLLLNSFYGKFGMKREQNEIKMADDIKSKVKEGEVTPVGNNPNEMLSYGVYQQPTEADANYIIPRLASAITASARIEMHKWYMRVREVGGKIYYCDTDSIVTNVDLVDIEPEKGVWVNHELGGMDLENEIQEYYGLRPKTYAEKPTPYGEDELEGYVIKGKGMKDLDKDTEFTDEDGNKVVSEAVDFEDFKKAFLNNEPERICSEWKGVKGLKASIKKSLTQGVETETYSRSLKGFDDKRTHTDDGLDSEPLHFTEFVETRTEEEKEEIQRQRIEELINN